MVSDSILTKEIAEQFVADKYSVHLDQYNVIEDAAAESLSKHQGDLNLDGLTGLSVAAAESVAEVCRRIGLSAATSWARI